MWVIVVLRVYVSGQKRTITFSSITFDLRLVYYKLFYISAKSEKTTKDKRTKEKETNEICVITSLSGHTINYYLELDFKFYSSNY